MPKELCNLTSNFGHALHARQIGGHQLNVLPELASKAGRQAGTCRKGREIANHEDASNGQRHLALPDSQCSLVPVGLGLHLECSEACAQSWPAPSLEKNACLRFVTFSKEALRSKERLLMSKCKCWFDAPSHLHNYLRRCTGWKAAQHAMPAGRNQCAASQGKACTESQSRRAR